jgi:hypothetical protein
MADIVLTELDDQVAFDATCKVCFLFRTVYGSGSELFEDSIHRDPSVPKKRLLTLAP